MTILTVPNLEQAAVTLAERGYHVFPCKPHDKRPLTTNGFKAATRDERQILHWWDRNPDANIGIACEASGITVLDIDSKHGADPHTVLTDHDVEGAAIVQTGVAPPVDDTHPRSLVGIRGVQVYFRGHLRTGELPELPGCEIRGDGAYVVAPPSLHPSGVAYGPQLPMPVGSLPEVPGWLGDLATQSRTTTADPIDEEIIAGGRNNKLASIAGTLRRRGMDAEEIEATLTAVNEKRCRPPLTPDEVHQIAHSIARYKPAQGINSTPKFQPLAKDAQAAAKRLGDLLELGSVGMHITAARLYGKGSSASLEIDLSNRETMSFGTLRDMMRPQSLIAEVAACSGSAPSLKQVQCAEALTLARQVATLVEVDSDNDIAREWGRDFLDLAETFDIDINNQAERWRAFELLAVRDPWSKNYDPHNDAPRVPVVLRHLDGARYVRTLWFERYVRSRDSSVSRTAIGARMARVGWQRRGKQGDIKATSPARAEYRIWPFWIVPDGWEDDLRAAA